MRGAYGVIVATLLVVVVCVLAGAFLAVNRGWFPIGADNPVGAPETKLAGVATHAYLSSHAPKQENPIEPTELNLIGGAREYEEHCAACHGGAAQRISSLRDRFSPPPQQLIDSLPTDPDGYTFWVTKHGIRLTGMPAFQNVMTDEEIWKVVGFLKRSAKLPPDVQTAWADAAAGHCVTCHGGSAQATYPSGN